jgi:hypothetical protein
MEMTAFIRTYLCKRSFLHVGYHNERERDSLFLDVVFGLFRVLASGVEVFDVFSDPNME